MNWTFTETQRLHLLVDRIAHDLGHPLDVVVAGSGRGELAFALAERLPHARIVGCETDDATLTLARSRAAELEITRRVEFIHDDTVLPLPSGRFGAVVRDSILYPRPVTCDLRVDELARILKPRGVALVTDVVAEQPFDRNARAELARIGFDDAHVGSLDETRRRFRAVGVDEAFVDDITPLLRPLWEARRLHDQDPTRAAAYSILLDRDIGLGGGIFYTYLRAKKARARVEAPVGAAMV